MIGKAIYEGILIEQVLNPVFLNLILKISNGINDFRYYGLQEYNSICQLRKNDVRCQLFLGLRLRAHLFGD